ncbi:hypothetical protein M3Y99_01439900 [Aphelenchoides fujianensis]|nr:hypothetical protein M3Y99_01464300 [Aphelenchoides fujianensis]KAI6223655.1 hypothetical protein M3Y99_01439900 [Aphelenchoides fujianensis]
MKKATAGIKFDDLRIRKIPPEQLPFFRRHPDFSHSNSFVVDAAYAVEESADERSEDDRYMKKMPTEPAVDVKMEGLEIVGEPLEVSMLDEDKLNDLEKFGACGGYQLGIAEEAAPTDISPLSVWDTMKAIGSFQNSDYVRGKFLEKMGYDKLPKNFSTYFFSKADDGADRTAAMGFRYVDGVEYSGVLKHQERFDEGVRAYIDFKLYAAIDKSRLRSVQYHSVYNALCSSQLVAPTSNWPRFRLHDKEIHFADEEEKEAEQKAAGETTTTTSDFVPALFSVRTAWKEASLKSVLHEEDDDVEVRPKYFEKPGGLCDAVVTVKPGWLDNRVKGYDRTMQIKFLLHLCECLQKNEIEWPSHREHPELLAEFRSYISTLSIVEAEKNARDFVEGLWDFLLCCRSFAALRSILKETFDAFSRGALTAKYIHVGNSSGIARIIKTMDRNTAVVPRLDVWNCVQMMVEVGVDRLRRDMIDELVNKKRFAENSFAEFVKVEPRYTVDQRMRVILNTHLVLQSINLINEHATIKWSELQTIFNLLFYQYSHSETERPFNESFSFNTKVCNVENFVFEMNRLREWSATFQFADNSAVRSDFAVHLTRFTELKRLAKVDATKRYTEEDEAKRKAPDETAYWDSFDCLTFAFHQKTAVAQGGPMGAAAGDHQ